MKALDKNLLYLGLGLAALVAGSYLVLGHASSIGDRLGVVDVPPVDVVAVVDVPPVDVVAVVDVPPVDLVAVVDIPPVDRVAVAPRTDTEEHQLVV